MKALEKDWMFNQEGLLELDEMTPCSLEVVSVAVCDAALVGELLLLALGGEPGNRKDIGSVLQWIISILHND